MAGVLPFVVAPFVGSLLGVLILRLPAGRPVGWARSACASCGRVLGVAELVPVASYAVLRGRCRGCGTPIGVFHLQVELAAVAVPVWVLGTIPPGGVAWASFALGWVLLALAWIDLRAGLLPDALTLPLILAGLGECLAFAPEAMLARTAGAAAGYAAFRAVDIAYRWWRGRAGLGPGDAKLLAAIGAWVGVAGLPWVVVVAAISALLAVAGMMARGARVSGQMVLPFGPFLALAGFGVWMAWVG